MIPKRFDPATIPVDASVAVIGRRYCGKSLLLRDLMYRMRDRIPAVQVASPTEDCRPFYRDFFPDINMGTAVLVTNLADSQKLRTRDKSALLLILDDTGMERDPELRSSLNVLVNGRFYNICCMLSSCTPLSRSIAENFDYVFIFAEDDERTLSHLYRAHGEAIPSFDMFKRLLRTCTKDYGCMVIVRSNPTAPLDEKVFQYKAKMDLPKFRCFSMQERRALDCLKHSFCRRQVERWRHSLWTPPHGSLAIKTVNDCMKE
jgi:hypothetical protein